MQRIIAKVDYELYEALVLNKDVKKVEELWRTISQNSVFLSEAIKIVPKRKSNFKRFTSPMIVFMMLKFPDTVPTEIYKELVSKVLLDNSVARVVALEDGTSLDYLELILQNNNLILNDYQKDYILKQLRQEHSIITSENAVVYQKMDKVFSRVIATYSKDDFEVRVTEYESAKFDSGDIISCQIANCFRNPYSYHVAITENPNFQGISGNHLNDLVRKENEFDRLFRDIRNNTDGGLELFNKVMQLHRILHNTDNSLRK